MNMKFVTTVLVLSLLAVGVSIANEDVLVEDDFESGAGAPKGWVKGNKVSGVKHKYDKKVGKSGSRSLSLIKTENRYFPPTQWSRKLKYKGDKNGLKISANVRAQKTSKAIIDVIFLDDDNEWISHEWACYIGAKNSGDAPANHDWKEYTGQISIPDGTNRIQIALQIYGPGKVWFDDLKAVYVDAEAAAARGESGSKSHDNMVEVSVGESQGNYLYVPPKQASDLGNALLVVLPGGDGSADFHPFVSNIHANSLGDDFALAQPVAKKWTSKQFVVWPTSGSKVKKMKYTTEELIEATIADVGQKIKLDSDRIYVLAWSSGGPAAYAALLQKNTALTGGILAMSVFKPNQLPELSNGKDRSFYILHSKNDKICPHWMAKKADELFSAANIRSKLVNYSGGHGWRGDVFGNIQKGIEWLTEK